ncbi:tRNA pseudouridine(13) synthase TruD [Candidatus Parcubacteria bacterium]|nr:tRNA pseudouridine(13) synthase TruD [Candidatus Parcubacteria bacterium]
MQSDRMKQMAEERARLEEEKVKNPSLFPATTWSDDNHSLETLGIHIPEKDLLPRGFLKLLPSDFIVEEVAVDGRQTSVDGHQDIADSAGDTVYATLVKCGLSTLEAVDELAKLLGTTKDKIQYAGIKDKDAITSQEISMRGIPKDRVLEVSSPHLFLKDVRTGKGVIQKGGLKGNRFTILVRIGEDTSDTRRMKKAVEQIEYLKENGFYNFFYLQRFGTPRLNNYKWGISILKGDYEKAVRGLISDPGLREIPYFLEMRKGIIALAPDWAAVLLKLKEFPLVFPSEIKVVEHLVQKPGDFAGALQKIEDQVMLWVSAVSSLVYNRKLSAYIMAGVKPPRTLPLFLSPDRNDWLPYADDLEGVGIFPPDFNNLRYFRSIMLKHREIETVDQAEIHKADIISEGIVIQFTLGKGEYATTFLSHFVTLLGGKIPEDMSGNIVDVKKALGEGDTSNVLETFKELNVTKKI